MDSYELSGVEHEYARSMADAYARYVRLDAEPARRPLLAAMVQADQYATEVRSDECPQDTDTMRKGLTASQFILRRAIETSPEPIVAPKTSQFIDLFDTAMDALYSGELSLVDQAYLFDMARQAAVPLDGRKDRDQAIRRARASFVAIVFGPNTPEAHAYQNVDLVDFLKTTSWLYGTTDEIVETRGWSYEPQQFFREHLPTLAAATEGDTPQSIFITAQKIVYGRDV